MIKGNKEILVVQGDSYQKNVIIENVEPINIDAIYISCKDLAINKQLTYNNEEQRYEFFLSADETMNLKSMLTDFDITIYFTDGKVKTISYKAKINVLPKINKVER